jgi:hypothetical protein
MNVSLSRTIPTLAPAIIDAFTNESHKIKLSNGIDKDKMKILEAKIRAIEGVDLYNPVQAV